MPTKWMSEARREAFVDYHNGAVARDLMRNFSAERYVDTMIRSGANRAAVFFKCHHGFAYYPTQVGAPHPHLKGDFSGSIARECQKRGLPVVAYYNTTRDGVAFDANPDWRQTKRDGTFSVNRHIKHVCVNTPYVMERLWPMVDEILEWHPWIAGFFFDGTVFMPGACFCEYCLRKMKTEGINPDSEPAVLEFQARSLRQFMTATTERIRARIADPLIYYNGVDFVGRVDSQIGQTHLYIESLPSKWGFERTPFFGRYYRAKGISFTAQTGRFHEAWADFGGLKPDSAFIYDAGLALATGAAFSIGDQANPDGELDPAVYRAESVGFAHFAAREQWSTGAASVPYVGLLCRRHVTDKTFKDSIPSAYGWYNALAESHFHFDPIDESADYSPYTAIVAEGYTPETPQAAARLCEYVKNGGLLLASGPAMFLGAGRATIEEAFGMEYFGLSPFTNTYVRTPQGALGEGLPATDWIAYAQAFHIKPAAAQPLAEMVYPFTEAKAFRTTSHRHGHPGAVSPFPAATIHAFGAGQAMALAMPLGAAYYSNGYHVGRNFLKNLLKRLIAPEKRLLEVDAPVWVETILTRQPGRQVIHLLAFHANRTSQAAQVWVVEDVPAALDVRLRLRAEKDPSRVYLAPERAALEWRRDGAFIEIALPRFDIHAMAVVEE